MVDVRTVNQIRRSPKIQRFQFGAGGLSSVSSHRKLVVIGEPASFGMRFTPIIGIRGGMQSSCCANGPAYPASNPSLSYVKHLIQMDNSPMNRKLLISH